MHDFTKSRKGFRLVLIAVISGLLLTSCDLFTKPEEKKAIARVGDSFLYEEDVTSLVAPNASPEDSALIVSSYINRWATQKLLLDRARVNLTEQQQNEFDKLVRNYKNELYAKAYKDVIVGRQLDTVVDVEEAQQYYKQNGQNFVLNEDLLKLRYINLMKKHRDFEQIKRKFRRFTKEDKSDLLDRSIQFTSYSLNDSIWVKAKQVYQKIGPLSRENEDELLKKQNFLQLEDSLGVYLVFVKDVRFRNEQAPLQYSLPTVEQILINKRKLELIKNLEKEITQDAIKNEKFEVYN